MTAADPTPGEHRSAPGTARWRLDLSYDGSGFRGFAAQPGLPTVAGALADALARSLRLEAPPLLVCAGRTDAGVHARGQVVHVDLPGPWPVVRGAAGPHPMEPDDLRRVLNRQLSPSVVVRRVAPAPEGFDARRSATARRYRYLIWNAPAADPLLAGSAWHVPDPLDLRAMEAAADTVIGQHDFRAFCRRAPGSPAGQPIVRTVTGSRWGVLTGPEEAEAGSGRLLRFEIEAGSFCHQMVRSLVATLVEVGRGRGTAASVLARLRSGERTGLARPAPALGLCLVAVAYPGDPAAGSA